MVKWLLSLLILNLSFFSYADEGSFYLAHLSAHSVPLLIYAPKGRSPSDMLQKYEKALNHNSEMVELFQGKRAYLELVRFEPITLEQIQEKAVLIANHPKDYSNNSDRLLSFQKHFRINQVESILLPFAYDLVLRLPERRDFINKIANYSRLLVSMGGQDVHTALYGQENFHAVDTNLVRDRFELDLVRKYIQAEKGFFLGVCRGSQLASVALGYKLIQDLPFLKGDKVLHASNWHEIELLKTRHALLAQIFPGRTTLNVNSLHHQAVVFKDGGPLELSAKTKDQTVEATEFKNGKGLLLQFHPEYMNNEDGKAILTGVIRYKKRLHGLRCQSVWLTAK